MKDPKSLNLRQLEAYQAIVATGSTLSAARQLEVSQSAVSRLLGQLEESLDVQLFVRDKGRLIATQEGKQLSPMIEDLLDRSLTLKRTADDFRRGNSKIIGLRVAFPNSMTLGLLPRIVDQFLSQHDQVTIEIMTGPYNAIERMIVEDEVELGFLRIPVQQRAITTTAVFQTDSVCVMAKDHPFAGRSEIAIADLKTQPMILLGRQRAPRRDVDAAFLEEGIVPNVRIETHSVSAACGFAAQGIGITIVNRLMASDFRYLPIVAVPLVPKLTHSFALGFSSKRPISTTAEAFAIHTIAAMKDFGDVL